LLEGRPGHPVQRIPNRTLLLMLLALIAFMRLWCVSHAPGRGEPTAPAPSAPASSPTSQPVEVTPQSAPPPRTP